MILVSHFTTAETQRDFGLVAFSQEADQATQLDVVVAIVRTRAELDFLNLDLFLLQLGFMLLFGLLVFELTVVHQFAHRRLGCRGNLDQINFALFGHRQCFTHGHDTELFAFFTYQADFTAGNFTVDPWFTFLSYSNYS